MGRRLLPYGLALLGGAFIFLGFAGFDLWPFAFVAFVPLFAAFDLLETKRTRSVVGLSFLFGFVGIAGGYYWIVEMLENFSGFSFLPNVFFASALFLYLALQFVLFGWLTFRATQRGYNLTLSAVAAFAVSELLFPNLFPFYYGASFHELPLLIQIVDFGGMILLGMVCMVVNGAIYEIGRAIVKKSPVPRAAPVAALVAVGLTLGYGAHRIGEIDARIAEAKTMKVGLVQVNMGLFEKREDPFEGHRRHIEQSRALEREEKPDLIVWPESAFNYALPEGARNLRRAVMASELETPILFGGLARREVDGVSRIYNTAYLIDGQGNVRGTYDKTYLLAFGEYLPFGETFPILYEWSPNSGRFTPGSHVRPLDLDGIRFSTLVCYEDILPGFVRKAVQEGDPHLLVNVTNDAWFGDTHEPWIHLALAKFRAIEHRRALVRVTNSGVSAVVDPVGRVVTHSGVFVRANLTADVPLLTENTLYLFVGDWPGYLAFAAIAWMAFVRRRKSAVVVSVPVPKKKRASKAA